MLIFLLNAVPLARKKTLAISFAEQQFDTFLYFLLYVPSDCHLTNPRNTPYSYYYNILVQYEYIQVYTYLYTGIQYGIDGRVNGRSQRAISVREYRYANTGIC